VDNLFLTRVYHTSVNYQESVYICNKAWTRQAFVSYSQNKNSLTSLYMQGIPVACEIIPMVNHKQPQNFQKYINSTVLHRHSEGFDS
jgi:hypothetical protein